MVGVKQFDEQAVMDTVTRTFWERGYAHTTMGDLADATGVIRGSLYHAFGDKEVLMLAALDHYMTAYGRDAREALQRDDPVDAIRGFLDAHIERMKTASTPGGCLMCQAALECGGEDSDIGTRVAAYFKGSEDAIYKVLKKGVSSEVLKSDIDVRALARFYLGVSRGMAVVHRAYGTLRPIRDMANVAMETLALHVRDTTSDR